MLAGRSLAGIAGIAVIYVGGITQLAVLGGSFDARGRARRPAVRRARLVKAFVAARDQPVRGRARPALERAAIFVRGAGALRAPWRSSSLFVALVSSPCSRGAVARADSSRAILGVSARDSERWCRLLASRSVATAIMLRGRSTASVGRRRLGATRRSRVCSGSVRDRRAVRSACRSAPHRAGWLRRAAAAGAWSGAGAGDARAPAGGAGRGALSRGYFLSVLRDGVGLDAGHRRVTSLGFGLLHLTNPGVTAESVALVMLAGFFLAAVLYATRSLYAAWMAHFAWNWTMAVVFHAAVSGLVEAPDYRYVDAGPDWADRWEVGTRGRFAGGARHVAGARGYARTARLASRGRSRESYTMADRVAVIGAGQMGNGIAHVFAQRGFDVTMIDVSADALEARTDTIAGNLDRQMKKGTLSGPTRTRSSAA